MDIQEEIARALADADPEPYWPGQWDAKHYYAELAAALMPLVKRAQAEALREAADDVPYYPAILERWLRDRADRIEQGETDD